MGERERQLEIISTVHQEGTKYTTGKESVKIKDSYKEEIEVKPARDEKVLVSEAYDEKVYSKVPKYRPVFVTICVCGKTKKSFEPGFRGDETYLYNDKEVILPKADEFEIEYAGRTFGNYWPRNRKPQE